jgi:hypothetical protein
LEDSRCSDFNDEHPELEFWEADGHNSCVQMKNRLLLLFLFPFFASLCRAQVKIEPIELEWAAFSSPLHWESPPPELQSKTKTASARIRVLFPSGEYGEVFCLLVRQGDGSVSISRGDGEVVAIGSWKQEGDHVAVHSRIVYRTVVIFGRPIPEAETVEHLKARKSQYWTIWDDKGRCVPLRHFKDWGYLASLIRCDREYFDGQKRTTGTQPCMSQFEQ